MFATTFAGSIKVENHKQQRGEKVTNRELEKELVEMEIKWPVPSETRQISLSSNVKFMVRTVSGADSLSGSP